MDGQECFIIFFCLVPFDRFLVYTIGVSKYANGFENQPPDRVVA